MPKLTAYADVFRDWEALLGACDKNLSLLPDIAVFRDNLAALLQAAKETKLHQENLEGNRRAATQKLRETVDLGREAQRKLRNFVIIRLGSKSQHLLQFGIAPLGKRRKSPAVKPPEEGEPQTKAEAPKPEE